MMFRRSLSALLILSAGCTLDQVEVSSTDEPVATSNLVINEFTAGSSGSIEIYNGTGADIDASGWSVDDVAGGGTAPKAIASGTVVPAGGLVVVTYGGINTASADSVRLVDSAGVEIDSHGNDYAGSSIAGLCFGRQPDGGSWATGSIACTPGASNAGPTCTSGCDSALLTINEFTSGNGGWIELYNAGTAAADLTGWKVDDVAGAGASPKAFTAGTQVAAGGLVSIAFSGINTSSTDQVRLLDAGGAEVDSHGNFYTASSTAGLCFGRQPDGGSWAAGALACSRDATNCGAGTDCAPVASGGDGLHVLLRGTVVGPSGPYTGEVLIEGDTITCAAPSCAGQPGAATAAVADTHGIILPGLIDAHNHILFDVFDESDWSPTKLYQNHDQWPNDARYGAMVDTKQYLNGEAGSPVNVGCEMIKYGELKGVIAGTTSIQGSANPANKACYASVARTIDQTPNDLGTDRMQTATIFPTTATADGVCSNFDSGVTDTYVIHVGEGIDEHARSEFDKLGTITTTDQCLYAPQTTIVHGTAFGDAELQVMADDGMSLVWSPRSNVFLYGGGTDLSKTANIPLALSKGINVALAPDWSIGGSQNLLDELRFADQVDNAVFGDILTPHMLFDMATMNAARALGLDNVIGSIEPGKKADLFVLPAAADPYAALLAAHPAAVRLVMVGGRALYGDPAVQAVAPASPGCETLNVCGASKFVCIAEDGGTATNKLGQTLAQITDALAGAITAYDALDLSAWNFAPIAPLTSCP
jgi:5-methylthioadenosine/S-adenosylhomocysteine deaminase